MRKRIFYFITIFLFFYTNNIVLSCTESNTNKKNNTNSIGEFVPVITATTKDGNKTTTMSTDTNELKKYLAFNYFKPEQVKFHLTYIDNSVSNDRLSVPGPSDFYLEAILYFDTITFKAITTSYMKQDWVAPKYNKEEFNFSWMDAIIKQELLHSDSNYHGHVDLFFTMLNNRNCHIWMLNRKLLIHWHT
ncbi:MAG: hypothetical protein ABI402_01565 [Ferruginibacter sp.]